MGEIIVGIRDLKARLAEYVRQVQGGQAIIITDHGKPVGRILLLERDISQKISDMQRAGLLAWNGQSLPPIEAPVVNRSGKLISDLIVEMRDGEE